MYRRGITIHSVNLRYSGDKFISNYNIDIISEVKMCIRDAYLEEQNFKKNFVKYKYSPKTKIAGHTECFNKEIYNVMFNSN